MPLQATSGAASYDAFGGGVPVAVNYIEDVFSTYLYDGSNASPTVVTNGIDLSGKGGLVWLKGRSGSFSTDRHELNSTNFSVGQYLSSNNTFALSSGGALTTYSTDGFTLGTAQRLSFGGGSYVSWTFRKQPKFFDVVTWSGNNTARTIAHNLGSAPGCIIVKAYSGTDAATANWAVYHQSLGNDYWLKLESTGAALASGNLLWTTTVPTSTEFSLGGGGVTEVNKTGHNYIAYVFAHNAGGFGLTGTDNVISCGSFTTNASGATSVTLGYEPQWVMIKPSSGQTGDWTITDNMRGFPVGGKDALLYPNTSGAEGALYQPLAPNATGFDVLDSAQLPGSVGYGTYIYIAIRRGPMKVPTSGTSVFSPNTTTNDNNVSTTGFPVDMFMEWARAGSASNAVIGSRLTGSANALVSSTTAAEAALLSGSGVFSYNTGVATGVFASAVSAIQQNFQRAPSFFDEVCYTGTGTSGQTFSHNLGVVPELMIVKRRSTSGNNWAVYSSFLTATNRVFLNTTAATAAQTSMWNDTEPTSTVFTVGSNDTTNASGSTFVNYLFATCAGVSKVGSYTGTGALQTINCGFTGGARFVLIKKTSGTGSWYVWDSARGIVSGNDPYLLLNSTAAEVTNTDYIDTYSAGFEISSTAPSEINENGGSFIFLAIA